MQKLERKNNLMVADLLDPIWTMQSKQKKEETKSIAWDFLLLTSAFLRIYGKQWINELQNS